MLRGPFPKVLTASPKGRRGPQHSHPAEKALGATFGGVGLPVTGCASERQGRGPEPLWGLGGGADRFAQLHHRLPQSRS